MKFCTVEIYDIRILSIFSKTSSNFSWKHRLSRSISNPSMTTVDNKWSLFFRELEKNVHFWSLPCYMWLHTLWHFCIPRPHTEASVPTKLTPSNEFWHQNYDLKVTNSVLLIAFYLFCLSSLIDWVQCITKVWLERIAFWFDFYG